MALNVSRPVRCGKCDEKFTRTHGRQKFCITCIPNWRRTRAAVRQAGRIKPDIARNERPPGTEDAFTYADLCSLWAKRTARLAEWLEATGRPVREYPDFPKLTAREVSVAVGWVPWPESWPARCHRAAA